MKRSGDASQRKAEPVDLEVIQDDEGFALALDGEMLLTADGGIPLRHTASHLLNHIASEFDGHGTMEIQDRKIMGPKFFGSHALFSIQKEWIEPGKDDLSLGFEERLLCDPVLHPVAGPEVTDQYARWQPISNWLGDRIDRLRKLALDISYWHDDETGSSREDGLSRARDSADVITLCDEYLALAPEQRAVVMMLHAVHDGPVLFPLALVLGRCTVAEYAQGVMASHAILSGVFGDVDDPAHLEAFEGLRGNARTGLEYVQFHQEGTPGQRAREIIADGEGARLEYKSTFRFNLHTEKNDAAITHACLKTIAAFLNTSGGKLLIGVADDGRIVGIDKDGFQNADKFQLHLWSTLKQALGEVAAIHVNTEVLPADDGSICVVDCGLSSVPVYCKMKGGDEQFYVRTGPGTTLLAPRVMVKYIEEHFRKGAVD